METTRAEARLDYLCRRDFEKPEKPETVRQVGQRDY